jgi:hypothetical protein
MLETHFATQNRIIQLKLQFLCVSLKTERFIPVDKRFHLFILILFLRTAAAVVVKTSISNFCVPSSQLVC